MWNKRQSVLFFQMSLVIVVPIMLCYGNGNETDDTDFDNQTQPQVKDPAVLSLGI